jgi:regulator of sirC expression with transglutaminase-like and TPR domain
MPAYCRAAAFDEFARALASVETTRGLFRAAFAIALHERPQGNVDQGEITVAELAKAVKQRVRSASPQARIAHLHDVLFDVVGFRGNVADYYNPVNSYLPDVLSTHQGLPITLVLIYKCVAEQVGLSVQGINAPGHFVAAVEYGKGGESSREGGDWMYVDPFYGGEVLDARDLRRRIAETTGRDVPEASDLLRPATHRQWLARMLHNLQAIFAQTGRERDLFAMQELHELLATRG